MSHKFVAQSTWVTTTIIWLQACFRKSVTYSISCWFILCYRRRVTKTRLNYFIDESFPDEDFSGHSITPPQPIQLLGQTGNLGTNSFVLSVAHERGFWRKSIFILHNYWQCHRGWVIGNTSGIRWNTRKWLIALKFIRDITFRYYECLLLILDCIIAFDWDQISNLRGYVAIICCFISAIAVHWYSTSTFCTRVWLRIHGNLSSIQRNTVL